MKRKAVLLVVLALVFVSFFFYSITAVRNPASLKKVPINNPKQMTITSPQFEDKGAIPSKYTCDGDNINPPLAFNNIPVDSRSLALVVEDPDAPGKTWIHWIVFNINPTITFIDAKSVPSRSTEGVTDFGKVGYGGPCPPNGTHRYHFKLYALDTTLDQTEDITRNELTKAMEGHILSQAELVGLYSRE